MFPTQEDVEAGLRRVWEVMDGCIERGLAGEGVLPGGLKVSLDQAVHQSVNEESDPRHFGHNARIMCAI
jgi:L-serine dehydratase